MIFRPIFPTKLHQDVAELVKDFFFAIGNVDTVLVVNSCARGKAVPESDLDFAILIKPGTTPDEIANIQNRWKIYSETQPAFLKYKRSNQFAHLHLDIITGDYIPAILEKGEPIDYFEIEIGNQICYSAPMGDAGSYFKQLQNKWLPYYSEELRSQRLAVSRNACKYDLEHIPFLIRRELYFHAFDILYKAFQEFLQTIFIVNRTYPIAYNKWIKEQIAERLNMPDLYSSLLRILSINNIESNEMLEKVKMLGELINSLTNE